VAQFFLTHSVYVCFILILCRFTFSCVLELWSTYSCSVGSFTYY